MNVGGRKDPFHVCTLREYILTYLRHPTGWVRADRKIQWKTEYPNSTHNTGLNKKDEEYIIYADRWRCKGYAPVMCERVDQAHIKRAFQTRIEEHIPTGALCHILRAHVLSLCMRPQFGRRFGKRRRSEFFFRLGRNSISVISPRLMSLYISSAHVSVLREDDVNEMWISPKKSTKLSFGPIIVEAIGS